MKKNFAFALALVGAVSISACCNNATVPAASCPPCDDKASGAIVATPGDTVVASYGDHRITMAELDKLLAKDIYALRQQALEAKVLSDLVDDEAKKAGKPAEDFLREIAEKAKADPLPDEQLMSMYEQLKPRLGDKTFEDVKPMLVEMMAQDAQKQAVMNYLTELKRTANVKISLPVVRTEVKAVGPSKGPENAPITLVEFSDFECPYCARAAATIDQVVKANEGKVRLVFRSYPLPFHRQAQKASEAALCANEQGKFWEMHDSLFGEQDKLGVDDMKTTAKNLGLDAVAFDTCLDSGKYAEQIQKDLKDGELAGVEGTPAVFINGRLLSGALRLDDYQRAIDEELETLSSK